MSQKSHLLAINSKLLKEAGGHWQYLSHNAMLNVKCDVQYHGLTVILMEEGTRELCFQ